jgi:hypothetical protein
MAGRGPSVALAALAIVVPLAIGVVWAGDVVVETFLDSAGNPSALTTTCNMPSLTVN